MIIFASTVIIRPSESMSATTALRVRRNGQARESLGDEVQRVDLLGAGRRTAQSRQRASRSS